MLHYEDDTIKIKKHLNIIRIPYNNCDILEYHLKEYVKWLIPLIGDCKNYFTKKQYISP